MADCAVADRATRQVILSHSRPHSRPRVPLHIMSPALRSNTLTVCALLWLSGCAWMVLHYFYPVRSAFGLGPNAWEPLVIRVHGIVAIGTVFLLGWISSRHISIAWNGQRNRISGIALSSACVLLALSGYALYYLADDQLRTTSAVIHQVLGVAAILSALTHWRRIDQSRSTGQS